MNASWKMLLVILTACFAFQAQASDSVDSHQLGKAKEEQ